MRVPHDHIDENIWRNEEQDVLGEAMSPTTPP